MHTTSSLATGWALSGLSVRELWVQYFGLGGAYAYDGLVSYLAGEMPWSAHEHDVLAHAVNEACADQGLGCPVSYANEQSGPPSRIGDVV
jgi:hypothetical protein